MCGVGGDPDSLPHPDGAVITCDGDAETCGDGLSAQSGSVSPQKEAYVGTDRRCLRRAGCVANTAREVVTRDGIASR